MLPPAAVDPGQFIAEVAMNSALAVSVSWARLYWPESGTSLSGRVLSHDKKSTTTSFFLSEVAPRIEYASPPSEKKGTKLTSWLDPTRGVAFGHEVVVQSTSVLVALSRTFEEPGNRILRPQWPPSSPVVLMGFVASSTRYLPPPSKLFIVPGIEITPAQRPVGKAVFRLQRPTVLEGTPV